MAVVHITKDRVTPFNVKNAVGDTFILDAGVSIVVAGDDAIVEDSKSHDNTFEIRGTIVSDDDAIVSLGEKTTVIITKTGRVNGDEGIQLGEISKVINNGVIKQSDYGVYLTDTSSLTNYGVIQGKFYAVVFDSGNRMVNQADGIIRTSSTGTAFAGSDVAGQSNTIVNQGLIDGGTKAIEGGAGRTTVINTGTIHGAILLGDGMDVFDNRGGTIDGDVTGGGGNDTLITDDSVIRLIEVFGGGIDTVKSTVTYTLSDEVENLTLLGTANRNGFGNAGLNNLVGNTGNNFLNGRGGNDSLDGKAGNDVLVGGAGAQDTFVFSTGYDRDTINDFEDEVDNINLEGFKAITSYNDLINNHARNVNGNLVIEAGSDRLTILSMTKAQLDIDEVFLS